MPQLTFPIGPDGLIVDVLVNLDAAALLPIRSSGQPRSPISGKGIIDTASNVTGVSPAILQQLGPLRKGSPTSTQALGGPVPVQLYWVSLHIRDAKRPNLPMFTLPSLLVMDLPPTVPHDALIGLDVLLNCTLIVDGRAGRFTIDF
jgi:hypothetical protein